MTASLRYLLGITLVSGGVAGIGVGALNSDSRKLDIIDKNDLPNTASESDRPLKPKTSENPESQRSANYDEEQIKKLCEYWEGDEFIKNEDKDCIRNSNNSPYKPTK